MGRVAAALVVLLSTLVSSAAVADDRATSLAADLVASFRQLCLTERPFESVAAELVSQGRVRKPRIYEAWITVDSALTEEVFEGAASGTKPAPAYDVTFHPGDISKGRPKSCDATLSFADYASDIAPFVARLTEVRPASPQLIKRLHDSCIGRECFAERNEYFWQLEGTTNTLIVLAYYGGLPGTILSRIELPN